MIIKAFKCVFFVTATAALLLPASVSAKEKLKIFILAGQSNTVGHARGHTIATLSKTGKEKDKELMKLVFSDSAKISSAIDTQLARARRIDELTGGIKKEKLKNMPDGPEKTKLQEEVNKLIDEHEAYKQGIIDSCKVSDRVYINSIADRNKGAGKLSVGYGADKKKIGTEYGFGLSIAEKVDGPILLIKTAWGGKSINYDFRPPSSGKYMPLEKEKAKKSEEEIQKGASLNWRMMNEHIHSVLKNLKANHPAYDEADGYEIAGFVWFQGYNDQFSDEYRNGYKQNMINFIKDIRKEYKTPEMPFIIGVLGTGMTKEKVDQNAVSQGQRAAALAPEFKGNVLSVESYTQYSHYSYAVFNKGWPKHYHEWDTVGSDRPYHYLGSGAFFVRLGDAYAIAINDLMKK